MLNVLIPMSGNGSRFKLANFLLPKPLIEVKDGKPMIQMVIENINIKAKYIFLVLKEHYVNFDLKNLLPKFCGDNDCEIVIVDKVTEGAACTCLLAKDIINNDDQLIIANSDQLVEWDPNKFLNEMNFKNADGGILTFTASDPKWSFVKLIPGTEIISEVAEKNPISDKATAGIYWFKNGKSFVIGAEQMISKNIRTRNEFYVCPVFNELIENGKQIYNYKIASMQGLGTPEDLFIYLNS